MQAIHFAAMTHQSAAVDTLISLGASINALDNKGNTPLHYATQFTDEPAFIQKLLDAGASINAVNNLGETALHFASADGNLGMVKFLVEHHASVAVLDKQGETPFQEAVKTQHTEVATFLSTQQKGAAINISEVFSADDSLSVLEGSSNMVTTEATASHSVYVQPFEAPIVHVVDAIL